MTLERSTADEELDVLVVGAGFAGVYQLDRLRRLGYSVKIWESGQRLGGIWYWNRYPGARVDSEGAIYQFSREDLWTEWNYRELYPGWAEVREYFDFLDKKLDISRDVEFGRRVERADFDEDSRRWIVRAEDGSTASAKFLVICTGFAAKPYIPPIPGIAEHTFQGPIHHTGLWPQEGLDLTGKRVAIIGTGASGVQVTQEAARDAAEVTVFQRTPNMAFPMRQKQLTEQQQAELKTGFKERFERRLGAFAGFDFDFIPENAVDLTPEQRSARYEQLWEAGGFRFWLGTFQDILFNPEANDTAYEFWRDHVRARINDPALAELLAPSTPPHPFGVKRPSLEQNFYDVFNQPNVHLVDLKETPIEAITEHGLRTSDREYEFDIIVLATGFDSVTGGMTSIEIHGTDGKTLKEKWADGVDSYFGVATAGFPNLLSVYGPLSPNGFCNGPTCAEVQGDLIVNTIEYLTLHGYTRIESTEEADEAWTAHIAEIFNQTLFDRAQSWYVGANIPGKKRQMLAYPGGLPQYLNRWDDAIQNDYAGFEFA